MTMKKHSISKIAVALAMLCVSAHAAAQLLAVKTNALMWGNLTPNIGLELVTSERTSVAGNIYYSIKTDKQPIDCRLRGGDLQLRYWFSNRPMARSFVALGVQATRYNAFLNNTYHIGDAAGPGLVYGYTLPLSRRFNVEFSAGMSMMWYRECLGGGEAYNNSGHRLMPMGLGISCSYIFK